MRFLSVNSDCFLIELASLEETLALYSQLLQIQNKAQQQGQGTGIKDLVPAAKTILVFFNELETDFQSAQSWISRLELHQPLQQRSKLQIVPIRYQGEDLAQVAEQQGLSVAEVIRRHQHSVWQVAFIGFAPGFAYLNSPDQPFTEVPRLKTPRKKIAAGSLGLAGHYSGIYPKNSPGGWQLIGTTTEKMWDLERTNPALLLPGMTVHFEDVTHLPTRVSVAKQLQQSLPIVNQLGSSVNVETSTQAQAVFEITAASLQMLMQDEGRLQQAALGVGTAGAMDQTAMHRANRIVGNATDTAVIEILNGGFKARMHNPAIVAITGARARIVVNYADGQQADFQTNQAIALDAEDELQIHVPTAGLRNYIALRGGFALDPVLNSYSFDSLALLGPAPLKVGDVLYQGHVATSNIQMDELASFDLPQVGDCVELEIVMGPRTDWFDAQSIEKLCTQTWLVTQESNRVGLRLHGAAPLTRLINHELDSEGTGIGALQIPPNGQPVLFMNDHPLTGGYPVIASVAKQHWDIVAQIPAGCRIKFKKITEFMDIESAS